MAFKKEEDEIEETKVTYKKTHDETEHNEIAFEKGEDENEQNKNAFKSKEDENEQNNINFEKESDEIEQDTDEAVVTIENNPTVINNDSNKEELPDQNKKTTKAIIIEEDAVCCPCCFCIKGFLCFNFGYLSSQSGFLKFMEVVIGLYCYDNLKKHKPNTNVLESYDEILSVLIGTIPTTMLLLACYLFSKRTTLLVRRSIFEFVFYILASIALIFVFPQGFLKSYASLKIINAVTIVQEVFSGVMSIYVSGIALTILYIIDGLKSFQFYMKTRRM